MILQPLILAERKLGFDCALSASFSTCVESFITSLAVTFIASPEAKVDDAPFRVNTFETYFFAALTANVEVQTLGADLIFAPVTLGVRCVHGAQPGLVTPLQLFQRRAGSARSASVRARANRIGTPNNTAFRTLVSAKAAVTLWNGACNGILRLD